MAKLIFGDFDAERFWKNDNDAILPRVTFKNNQRIVMGMEELQILFCNQNDIVYTRGPMNKQWIEYLGYIGFPCINLYFSGDGYQYNTPIAELLYEDVLQSESLDNIEIDEFAVTKYVKECAEKYRMIGSVPEEKNVKKVNSKIYSSKMRTELNLKNYAIEIYSVSDLENAIKKISENKKNVLLKEEYGVSGGGNLLLTSKSAQNRVIKMIQKQRNEGKNINLIAEPFLDKKIDFSCQFYISKSGEYKLNSIYQLYNEGLSYKESKKMDTSLLDSLEKQKYFQCMENISQRMYKDGYWGNVCVDSMILKSGEIVPIVEINARKSMSLLKCYSDMFLGRMGLEGILTSFNFSIKNINFTFEYLIELIEKNEIMFNLKKGVGIIILSEKTLYINRNASGYQGKFYFLSIGENRLIAEKYIDKLKEILTSIEMNIF